ncbi:MAG: hypothetical protein ACK4L7_06740 [Flavobacteriales bacterium]
MNTLRDTAAATNAAQQRLDIAEWLNALRFRKEEVGISEQRLEALVGTRLPAEAMAELEHFQNQFIREKEVIDELRHDIKAHENAMQEGAVQAGWLQHHDALSDRFATFERLYRELRDDYRAWLARHR